MKRLNILVVDDNDDAAWALSALLAIDGHRTQTARSGLDAVKAAGRDRYDAVLVDLDMPFMDGLEAGALLARLQPAPLVIACSGRDDPPARRRSARLGFAAHLRKPLPLPALHAALEPLLSA